VLSFAKLQKKLEEANLTIYYQRTSSYEKLKELRRMIQRLRTELHGAIRLSKFEVGPSPCLFVQ
jgi:hypothetical protein